MKTGILARYREHLPVTDSTPPLSLGEGDTPLVRAERLSAVIGAEVWLKLEGCNPTGSFKDRGMVVAVAKAMEAGSRTVICASTGNTAASAAAYAAKAGLMAIVVVPAGNIALGKLAQAIIHGARVLALQGNFDQALAVVQELVARHAVALVNSVNPDRIQGQKTAAFEVCDLLGEAPDILAIPVGNAGNITAYWRGFQQYHAASHIRRLPQMWGFQAAGAAPIVRGKPVAEPQTVATAICIGNPASWHGAVAARDESGGIIEAVSDEEILSAQGFLARAEGVFCELASAASVAGIRKLAREGRVPPGVCIVCILTGSGLKDPASAVAGVTPPQAVPAELERVERELGWS
ncbi:MAG: threonine synthase [Chloroflexi bacterium]|nr:threonine synthase [Chloroflexota bacterium]